MNNLLIIFIASCVGWIDAQNTRRGVIKTVYQHHFNPKDSLFLSYPEIKLFAGYSLNLLRTRCPKINSEHLFQFQKFIMTRSSSSTHQVTHKKEAFSSLLNSLRSCNSKTFQLKDPQTLSSSTFKWLTPVTTHLVEFWMIIKSVVDPIFDSIAKRLAIAKTVINRKIQVDNNNNIKTDVNGKDEKNTRVGRSRFENFVSLLADFYRIGCKSPEDMQVLFAGASKDFLGYVSVDSATMRKAGEYFLNDTLLKNMTECVSNMQAIGNI